MNEYVFEVLPTLGFHFPPGRLGDGHRNDHQRLRTRV
jgi:hypothetical protein